MLLKCRAILVGVGMHVKKIKKGRYLYFTEMQGGKKVETYCGSVDSPASKLKVLSLEKKRLERTQQEDLANLEAIQLQLEPMTVA